MVKYVLALSGRKYMSETEWRPCGRMIVGQMKIRTTVDDLAKLALELKRRDPQYRSITVFQTGTKGFVGATFTYAKTYTHRPKKDELEQYGIMAKSVIEELRKLLVDAFGKENVIIDYSTSVPLIVLPDE